MHTCNICLGAMQSSESFQLTECKHTFHKSCLILLLNNSKNKLLRCPYCRTTLDKNILRSAVCQNKILKHPKQPLRLKVLKNKYKFPVTVSCGICLEDLCYPDLFVLVECKHMFHKGCLKSLLTYSRDESLKCPYCRRPLDKKKISSTICPEKPLRYKVLLYEDKILRIMLVEIIRRMVNGESLFSTSSKRL